MEVQKLGCGAGWLEIKIPIYIIEGASIINNSREVGAAHVLSTWEFYWQSESLNEVLFYSGRGKK